MKPSSETLRQNLKAYRSARSLTQAELSEKAGVSINFLSQIEGGRKLPSFDVIDSLAAALKVPVFQLFADPSDLSADGAAASSVKLFLDDLTRQIEEFSKQLRKSR